MRCLGLLLLLVSALPAQFFDFAVTDNGQLYFATVLQTPGVQDTQFKVYRLTDTGPELFGTGGSGDDPFGLTASAPLVSGDGSITGWALTTPCRSPSCPLAGGPRMAFQLQGAGFTNAIYNYLQISRNGRFLLGVTGDFRLVLTELPSQRTTQLAAISGWAGPQTVADTGAALIYDPKTTVLTFRRFDGDSHPVRGSDDATNAALSPAGDRVAWERRRDGLYELVLSNSEGNSAIVLASAAKPLPYGYQPRFANDGTLAFLDAEQQPALVPPGGAAKRLTTIDGGVQRAIPSGDGRVAWLESLSGQLLRVRMADGAVEEVVPATPYALPIVSQAYPGSVIHFAGTGMSKTTHFRAGDVSLPLSALERDGAAVQLPWEYASTQQQVDVTVQADNNPFFQRASFFPLARPSISFERDLTSRALKAAHQDFRGLAGEADPAAPGETLHVFARNMGPVDRPVVTGQPSPDPPARVTTPLACYLFEVEGENSAVRPRGLEVPFAGLSSGLVGIYHIDVTIPADWTARDAMLECRMDTGGILYSGDSARLVVGSAR